MNYKLLVTLVFLVSVSITGHAQKVPVKTDPLEITKKAMDYYRDDKYTEALEEFNKLNENDTLYTDAQLEMVNLLVELKRYDSAIALAKLRIEENDVYASNYYTAMANALDEQGKREEAIKVYDEAIKKFPNDNMPHFNKGIVLQKLKKYDEAEQEYILSIKINPNHPGSHLRLGSLYYLANKPAQALMAVEYFLLLEPSSARSFNVLKLAQFIARNEKSKDDIEITLKDNGDNDFSELDALLKSKVAMSDKFKVKIKMNYDIIKQNQLLLEKVHYSKGDKGFSNQFYAPLYEEIWKNDFFEPFMAEMLRSVDADDVKKFLEKEAKNSKAFYKWIGNYVTENITPSPGTKWNPGEKLYRLFDNARLAASGQMKDGKLVGNCKYYYGTGNIKAEGTINDQDNKEGVWKYYYVNGNLKQIIKYENGKIKGEYTDYYSNGIKKQTGTIIDGNNEGEEKSYYSSGEISTEGMYKNSKTEGKVLSYYSNGKESFECTYVNTKVEGKAAYFYPNGQTKEEYMFKDGKREGPYKSYYANGKVYSVSTYINDIEEGVYTNYYITGTIAYTGNLKKGKRDGKWTFYHGNGKISDENMYAEGELSGTSNEYDLDGKLINVDDYKNGKLTAVRSYDKKGNVLHECKTEGKQFKLEMYWNNGNKRMEGLLTNQKKQGEWRFYSYNGTLESATLYKDDVLDGVKKEFYPDGRLKSEINYTNGDEDGLFKKYYRNGTISYTGWMESGYATGPWYYYRVDSSLEKEEYYKKGRLTGTLKEYTLYGKLQDVLHYDEYGIYVGVTRYDSAGNVRQKVSIPNGTGSIEEVFPNNKVSYKGKFIHGNNEGTFYSYYISGSPMKEETYVYDKADGVLTYYYENGKVQSTYTYMYGVLNGPVKKYYESGSLSEEETYDNGKTNGKDKSYAENGNVKRIADYVRELVHGQIINYDDDNHLAYQRDYYSDCVVALSYPDKAGKLVTKEVQNETVDFIGYFINGNKSVELHFKNGEYDKFFKRYFFNGTTSVYEEYTNGQLEGVSKYYYKNGKLKEETPYHWGEENGVQKYYYENGNLKSEKPYKTGVLDGWCKYYNEQGKLVRKVKYFSGRAMEEVVLTK